MANEQNIASLSQFKKNKQLQLAKNQTYQYNNFHIKDCTLGIGRSEKGILDLISLNNVVIENGKIVIGGTGNSNTYMRRNRGNMLETEINHPLYGSNLNQIYVGSDGNPGDSCSGGLGGGGLRIKCDSLILINSLINVSGCDCMNGNMWGCGSGNNGSCLIQCNELFMDKKSEIMADMYNEGYYAFGRIVIQKKHYLQMNKMDCVMNWYFRNLKCDANAQIFPIELNELIISYYFVSYDNYKISPKPIFVDDKWNKIEIKTRNGFVTEF
eukprot:314180_1